MNYLIVEDGIITNIIVADEHFSAAVGALPYYAGAAIGDTYDPPTLDKTAAEIKSLKNSNSELTAANADLASQLESAQSMIDAILMGDITI